MSAAGCRALRVRPPEKGVVTASKVARSGRDDAAIQLSDIGHKPAIRGWRQPQGGSFRNP